jgi:hypothetical protein
VATGEDRELLLVVYEFMSNGSLENHLFRSKKPACPSATASIIVGTLQKWQADRPAV